MSIKIPEDYQVPQPIKETAIAIKEVKDFFERALAEPDPRHRAAVRPAGKRAERQPQRCGASRQFRDSRAGRHPGRDRPFAGQVEADGAASLWV